MTPPVLGEIRAFARGSLPAGWLACDGSELAIADHEPLFTLLGWRFGGDRQSTFRLPALSSQDFLLGIGDQGLYPTGDRLMHDDAKAGEIRFFAGTRPPAGWMPCDGRRLPIAPPYLELYKEIGARWGGDAETFCLPDLWSEPAAPLRSTAPLSVNRFSYVIAIAAGEAGSAPVHAPRL